LVAYAHMIARLAGSGSLGTAGSTLDIDAGRAGVPGNTSVHPPERRDRSSVPPLAARRRVTREIEFRSRHRGGLAQSNASTGSASSSPNSARPTGRVAEDAPIGLLQRIYLISHAPTCLRNAPRSGSGMRPVGQRGGVRAQCKQIGAKLIVQVARISLRSHPATGRSTSSLSCACLRTVVSRTERVVEFPADRASSGEPLGLTRVFITARRSSHRIRKRG